MRDERKRIIPHPSALIPLLALIVALVATVASALDCPPAPTQWFTDKAGVVDAGQADALNRKLHDFEQQSGAQFIIYVLPALEGDAVERFTVDCAQKWGVGQKKYDNGLILFVFIQDRKVRIEVGYGLEGAVTDAYSSRVIRDYIAPHFRQNDYAGGLNAAADALMAKIRGGEPPVPPLNPDGRPSGGGSAIGGILPIIIFLVFLFFILPLISRSGCGGCFWPMFFLGGGGRGTTFGGGGFSGGGGWGGGGGFSGGGGSFGGGGATGGW